MDTPEELEGLSCCVGSIFGPRENSTYTSLQLNNIKSATRITIPRASPRDERKKKGGGSGGLFLSSFTLVHSSRAKSPRGFLSLGIRRAPSRTSRQIRDVLAARDVLWHRIRRKKTSARVSAGNRSRLFDAYLGWAEESRKDVKFPLSWTRLDCGRWTVARRYPSGSALRRTPSFTLLAVCETTPTIARVIPHPRARRAAIKARALRILPSLALDSPLSLSCFALAR